MILVKLELQGFKSFATKTVLEFNRGITAIVGPNGSGKSNIADAIRWVLGAQSYKQLRGVNMGDMIFSGTQYRKPVGFAEASLYFDNKNRDLDIDFENVKITRRIFRSGDSEYLINDKTCRLKDIQMLFFDTGVGKEGYSIIGQHEVNGIVESNSIERRGIFEEAAGIMKYKQKKLESLRKLASTEENLLRINDITGEVELQLGPLEQQADKAKEYLRVYDILRVNEVGLYLNNLEMFKNRITKHESDILDIMSDITVFEQDIDKLKNENKDNNIRIEQLEIKENVLKDELNNFIRDMEANKHEIILLKERFDNAVKEQSNIKLEMDELAQREKDLVTDYSTKEERRVYLEKQEEIFKTKLDDLQVTADKILAQLDESDKIAETLKKSIMDNMELISDVKLDINNEINEKQSIELQIEALETGLNKIIFDNDALLLEKQDNRKQSIDIKRSRDDLVRKVEELRKEYSLIQKNIDMMRDRSRETKTGLEVNRSNYNLIHDMEKQMQGYRHDVKAVLENDSLKGIIGAVGNLFSTDEIYNTAIESALAGNIQNIVVENEENAKQAIDFLKSNKLGRVTFLPVSSVRPNAFDKSDYSEIMSFKGVIDVAYKLVEYDTVYENIVKNLLGKTVLVESYDDAVSISRKTQSRYKLVTLTGEFFNTGGSISGGTQNLAKTGLLGRHKQLERLENRIEADKIKYDELIASISEHVKIVTKKAHEIDSLDNRIKEKDIYIMKLDTRAAALDETYKKNADAIRNSKAKKQELMAAHESFDSKLTGLNDKLSSVEQKLTLDRTTLSNHEDRHKLETEKRDNIYLDISDLKISLGSIEESLKSNDESLIRIGFEKQSLKQRKTSYEKRNVQLDEDKDTLEKQIREKSILVSDPDIKKEQLNKEIVKLSNARRKLILYNDDFVQNITDVNRDIMNLQNKISSLEVAKAKTETEITAMKDRMWDEYNLTHNDALQKHGEIENITEARKQIAYARGVIKQLGPVNLDAIEDYVKTNERYRFFISQKEDIEKSKEDLYKTINEMNTVMKREFREKFNIINENFNEIFIKLFDGGQARLELTDETDILECGIDIIAQPPGKKLQNMMLLSGGEKAFTAIALIFAMLKLNPSPFCIFDEVDTSLDDNNVLKYCTYLNNHKEETQFVLITHRKGTMENADSIYGVTMQEHGITKVVSMQLTD